MSDAAHMQTRMRAVLSAGLCCCVLACSTVGAFAQDGAQKGDQDTAKQIAAKQAAPITAPAPATELVLRAGAQLQGIDLAQAEVVGVSLQGVEIRSLAPSGSTLQLSWDLVRTVPPAFAPQAKQWEATAETAWRARSRLARGDLGAAEPLFEQLATLYAGTRGATSAMVWAGLLRCRLHRQAQVASVEAWLSLLASGENAPTFTPLRDESMVRNRTILDRETLLCPDLPPLWVPGAGVRTLQIAQPSAGETASEGNTSTLDFRVQRRLAVARVLAQLYELSAKHATGESVTLPDRPASDAGPEFIGARLVWDVLASQAGTPEQITQARTHLAEILATIEQDDSVYASWIESWARTALGRSLMASSQLEERSTGIAISLAVPALLADDSPYLAGLCLADVATLRISQGQITSAKALRDELRALAPNHPSLPSLEVALAQASERGATSTRDPSTQETPAPK